MGINTLVKEIQNTKWNMTDDFMVFIEPRESSLKVDSVLSELENPKSVWNRSILGISIPTISSPMMEHYLGGEWRIQTSKPEIFRFSMRFRDLDNGALRRYFATLWSYSQFEYVEKSYIDIKIKSTDQETILFESKKCLVEQVSEAAYDSGNANISEFSVEFRSPVYSDKLLKGVGSSLFFEDRAEDESFEAIAFKVEQNKSGESWD